MKNIRTVFMGTPSFAYAVLVKLADYLDVVMVVCQPDREKDRKGNYIFSPCKSFAIERGIEVFQPSKIREEYQKILDVKPDIIVTNTVVSTSMPLSFLNCEEELPFIMPL